MALAKKKPKAKKIVVRSERIERAEQFAYAYIRHFGNGAAAAREVYELEGNAAAQQASRLLTNAKVQKLVGEFLDAQRESLKKFTEQGNYYLTVVAQALIQIIADENASHAVRFEAMEKLMRVGGFEIAEDVAIAKMHARADAARGRAVLPGVAAPGSQPGAPQITDNSRRTIFLLSPPPIPKGGIPTPALMEQWKESYEAMGFRPGLDGADAVVDTAAHAATPRSPHGNSDQHR